MNRIKILLIGFVMTALTGCSKTVQWDEEVPLNTGDVIWVKRTITYKYETTQDNPFAFQYWPMGSQEIAFKWKGKKYNYVGNSRLILLAIQPNTQLPVLITPKDTGNWIRSRDFPCIKPYYEQLVVNESKWEWELLLKLEPWLFNLPRNLMAYRGNLNEMQERYTSNDRQLRDQTMTIQNPAMAQIDPSYQPEICTR